MQGMDGGPWTSLGSLGWFVGVWVVMMAAMMLPSVAPTVALYSKMANARWPLAPLVFTSGYLVVWGAVGALAFGVAEPCRAACSPGTAPGAGSPAGRSSSRPSTS